MGFFKDFWKNNKESIFKGAISSFASGGIGLGLNTVGSVIGNALSRGRMDKQADLEKSIMKYQQQLYDPSQQVNRLRRAGLNVGLMYSGNGMQSGGATGSIGMSSSDPQAVGMNPLMVSEIKTAESVQNRNNAEAGESVERTSTERLKQAKMEVDTAQAHVDYLISIKSADSVIEEAKLRVKNAKATYDKIQQDIATGKAQERMFGSQADLNESLKLTEDTMRQLDAAFKRANTKLTAQKVQESISQEFLNIESKNYLIEKQLTEGEERERIRADRQRLLDLSKKYQSEVTAIESNTALDAQRKALMISQTIENYSNVVNDSVDNIRKIVRDSKLGKGKSDKEVDSIVDDFVSDVTISAFMDAIN